MEQKKKKIATALVAEVAILIILGIIVIAGLSLRSCGAPDGTGDTQPTQQTTLPDATTQPTDTKPDTTQPPTEPSTETTETTQPQETKPTTRPKPTEPKDTEPVQTEPQLTDPARILTLARGKLQNLSGQVKEVTGIANPKRLTVSVSAIEAEDAAAQAIVDRIKEVLRYEQSTADPNVAVGDPNPFTYEYKLLHDKTEGTQHTFLLEYRFVSVNHQVSGQNYDTNRLVKDVCAYLDSLGKVKYDSQTSENLSSQPVIIPVSHPYETALSIAKAQVQSVSASYRNYDFYYSTLTITTKGGVEEEALCFYIVNK